MPKGWLFLGLAAALLTTVLWASPGVVHLKNGTQFSGDIDDTDPQEVTITLHGVREIFSRDDVDSIEYPPGLDEQYAQRLDKLSDRDIAGRLTVAAWARDLGRFDLARRAAAEALAIDPSDNRAAEMLHDIAVQAGLHHGDAVAATQPATRPVAIGSKPYLALDQINLIRQRELRGDETVRVTLLHDVRQRFLELGTTDSKTFNALSTLDQARQILYSGTAAMAADVQIETDPAALTEYRQRIQQRLIAGCATSGCHNALTAAGGLGLFVGDDSLRAWYTNFYMVQSYVRPPRPGGAVSKLMIDRTQPADSLLLNYALPRATVASPHPPARNFYPPFSGRNDPRYSLLLNWIAGVLKPDGGDYPEIHYQPPWSATTEPATAP